MGVLPRLSFLRLVNIFKILRCMRMLRLVSRVEPLTLLIRSIRLSIPSVLWSVVLLLVVQIAASIFMTTSLQSYLRDERADPEDKADVYTFFGTFTRSFITVLEMTLATGTWSRCGRVVVFKVSGFYMLFFFGYPILVSFATIRVIAALFLKDTLAAGAKQDERNMAETHEDPAFVKRLIAI